MPRLGIIGGCGLYEIEGLEDPKWIKVETPFGKPSDEYLCAKLSGVELVFLPRHGRDHHLLPSELNCTANIYGMKKLGVEMIISVSTVGSLKEEIKPLDILIPDQYVDRTNQPRNITFFGNGIVAHVAFANPSCPELGRILYEATKSQGLPVHSGGTYLNMEGPAFSTKAESDLYRSWGMDVIGMTNMPEARLAREAGICYVTICMVTDYDSWNLASGTENVSVSLIMDNIAKGFSLVKEILVNTIKSFPETIDCACHDSLKHAIITDLKHLSSERIRDLRVITGNKLDN